MADKKIKLHISKADGYIYIEGVAADRIVRVMPPSHEGKQIGYFDLMRDNGQVLGDSRSLESLGGFLIQSLRHVINTHEDIEEAVGKEVLAHEVIKEAIDTTVIMEYYALIKEYNILVSDPLPLSERGQKNRAVRLVAVRRGMLIIEQQYILPTINNHGEAPNTFKQTLDKMMEQPKEEFMDRQGQVPCAYCDRAGMVFICAEEGMFIKTTYWPLNETLRFWKNNRTSEEIEVTCMPIYLDEMGCVDEGGYYTGEGALEQRMEFFNSK